MADMIKFYKGAVASLPASGVNGAIYITTDEGGIYLGTGAGMKRLGDFIQVDAVANLPTDGANTSALYYCVAENVLAKWNGSSWTQVNRQKTESELKEFLGLGSAAYTDASAYDAAGAADAALTSAKAYTDSKIGELGNDGEGNAYDVKGYIDNAIAGVDAAGVNEKIAALESADAAIKGRLDTAEGEIDALQASLAEGGATATAIANAQVAADKAQGEVDALEAVVANYKTENDARVKALEDVDNATQAEMDAALALKADKSVVDAMYTNEQIDASLALKADKSVVDAMYTNEQIDGFIADAKKYADDNDADTKYGIVYDSDNKKIKLVEGGTEVEIDATNFIKDGMIDTVALSEDGLNLVITWNTDAGKDATTIPLTGLVDVYTGVVGDRVTVSVSSDDKISADLVAGSISKNYLDEGVQASLALADSALQEHQDISHLATEADLTLAENRISALEAIDHEAYKAYADQAEADAIAAAAADAAAKADAALEAAKTDAANKDAVVLSEAQGYTNQAKADAIADAEGKVNALAGNVYTKTETYTQDEVDAAIETAVTNACSWGEF